MILAQAVNPSSLYTMSRASRQFWEPCIPAEERMATPARK
jgi:hypothetical protein